MYCDRKLIDIFMKVKFQALIYVYTTERIAGYFENRAGPLQISFNSLEKQSGLTILCLNPDFPKYEIGVADTNYDL